MRDFIPIAKPIIGQEEIDAVEEVLKSGMLAQGETVKIFEDGFAAYLEVKNAIAVNNGTVALDLAIKALGLEPGSEIITPAFTFIATANCALYQGLRPVFADVDERTFNIDPDDLQERITPRTKAVIGVHLDGQPFPLSAVQEIFLCISQFLDYLYHCREHLVLYVIVRIIIPFRDILFKLSPVRDALAVLCDNKRKH